MEVLAVCVRWRWCSKVMVEEGGGVGSPEVEGGGDAGTLEVEVQVVVVGGGGGGEFKGLSFLWLTSIVPQLTPSSCQEPETGCSVATPIQLGFFFGSFCLMSIGSGCIRPCSMAFGSDQLRHQNNQRLMDSYFNWYYASTTISSIVASTAVVYIQDQYGWRVGLAVPVLVMFCAALMFLLGSSLYVKVEVKKSPFSGLIQVLIFAFRNRRIRLLPNDRYNHSSETEQVVLTDNLRFLDKACVVRDTDIVSSDSNPRQVPTVEEVEILKSLIRIIHVWSSGILLFTNMVQNFVVLQAEQMNRNVTSWFEIPAASFSLFSLLTLTIWTVFYDRIMIPIIAKFTHEPRGLHPETRMWIGLVLAIIATIISAIVEIVRRALANSDTPVVMSAVWLVPQLALLGLCEAFNSIGQMEYYYSELPKSMTSLVMAVFMVGMSLALLVGYVLTNVVDLVTSQVGDVSWLASDINKGHVDYYYWLLTFLNLLNLFYYLTCCRVNRRVSSSESSLSNDVEKEGSSSIAAKP